MYYLVEKNLCFAVTLPKSVKALVCGNFCAVLPPFKNGGPSLAAPEPILCLWKSPLLRKCLVNGGSGFINHAVKTCHMRPTAYS